MNTPEYISAMNFGHRHPVLLRAMQDQMQRVTLTSPAFRNDQMGPFLKELCALTGYAMALPMNTGSEAVETAIKVVRKWGYQVKGVPSEQAEIVVCANNFHGRTTTIVGYSSQAQYRQDFGPFTPGFVTVPFGAAGALEAAITPNTVAFLVEAIQGEGGVVAPPPGYLCAAAHICRSNRILFTADEVQTGLGRCGDLFACDHEQVRPDLMILGKALGGGLLPVSAVLSDREILGLLRPGDHGSTFGGHPLSAAVARAALQVLVDEQLILRSRKLGAHLQERLQELTTPPVKEIRGRGLFVGIELQTPARPFCEALQAVGILCKETHERIIRLAPPLVIQQEDLDWAIDQLLSVLRLP